MTALTLAYLFTVDGPVADGRGWLTAYLLIDRFLLVEAPAGMSALGHEQSFARHLPNVRFAPKADVLGHKSPSPGPLDHPGELSFLGPVYYGKLSHIGENLCEQ
jgi:hypothetical protein